MPEPKPDPTLDPDKLSLKSVWGAVSQLRTEQRANATLNDQAHKFTGERIEKIENALERVDRRTEEQGKEQAEQGKTLGRMEAHVETLVKAADLQAKSDASVDIAEKKSKIKGKEDTRRILKRIGLKLFYALLAGATLLGHGLIRSCL